MSETAQDGEDGKGLAVDLHFVGTEQLLAELMNRSKSALLVIEPLIGAGAYMIRGAGSVMEMAGLAELLRAHVARGVIQIVKQK